MFGQKIKDLRLEKGLTQSQLADKLSTTASTIGKYEREELEPNMEVIKAICKFFEVTSDYLIGMED